MTLWIVTAYADTPSRFDFEVEAASAEEAEARVRAIIEGDNDELIAEAFAYDCERGPLVINSDLTEERWEF